MASQRTGYDPHFLAHSLPLPTVTGTDTVVVDGSPIVDYVHFSLSMSRARRLAHWVAWNVDGTRLLKLSRAGLRFRTDPRVGVHQWGDELYADNPLDRGHLARRADLTWGPLEEAAAANRDSFLFPNIAPQMQGFNQSRIGGVWGRLEDALYEQTEVDALRLSVFGGCVFAADDRAHRGVAIPGSYWKVVAWGEPGAPVRLRARAFLMDQDLAGLPSIDLERFRVWQVPLADLERDTAVRFPAALHAATADAAVVPGGRRPIRVLDDVAW